MSDSNVPWLSVCIPTYNRPEKIVRTLKLLLPQLVCGVEIVIADNASDMSIKDIVVAEFGAGILDRNIRIIRNKYNVGMMGNFMRVLECASADWVWLLSDDDLPMTNAIETAREHVSSSGRIAICCRSSLSDWSAVTHEVDSLPDLLALPSKGVGGLLFMSGWLLHLPSLRPVWRWGYQASYTCASHLVLVLKALESGAGTVLVSTSELVEWSPPEDHWSTTQVFSGLSVLPELMGQSLPASQYIQVRCKLTRDFIPFWAYCVTLCKTVDLNSCYIRHMARVYRARISAKPVSVKEWCLNRFMSCLLATPLGFCRFIVRLLARTSDRSSSDFLRRL